MPKWAIVLAVLVLFYGLHAVLQSGIFKMPAPPAVTYGDEWLCRSHPYEKWYRCDGSVRER